MRRVQLAVFGLAAVVAAGCGSIETPLTTVEVAGKATLPGGAPLTGTVYFDPVDGKGRDQFTAVKDGAYSLVMMPGQYKVAFDLPEQRGGKATKVPAKYQSFKTTDLEVTVAKPTPDLALAMK